MIREPTRRPSRDGGGWGAPATVGGAYAIQDRLLALLDLTDPGPGSPRTVAGLDVACAGDDLAAAVVVLDAPCSTGCAATPSARAVSGRAGDLARRPLG